ncbi:retrotransposon protein, putative, ty1-copia subclass [Tanacetum coccineum]
MTTSVVTNSVFRGFFEKQKLSGPNFNDWYRQLRIVLSVMDKLDYLDSCCIGVKNSVCPASRSRASSDCVELQYARHEEDGHWKRNCPQNLAELLKNLKLSQGASSSGSKGNVIPRDGIFEIDLSNSYANDSSMYAVSNKNAKLDLDSTLLWHCRLRHINKKRIEKLQHDGLLNSTNLKAFEKCVSCMSGKMARKPYTHQVERAKDLL